MMDKVRGCVEVPLAHLADVERFFMLAESRSGIPDPIAPLANVRTSEFAKMCFEHCPVGEFAITVRTGIV